jgi:predicted phosphodiesterase
MKLLKEFGLTEKEVRKILINRNKTKPKILKRYITEKKFGFAIVSDTHLCSRQERLDELKTFYEICRKTGVKHVLHAGDLMEGSGRIYRGQMNDIHTYGAIRQVNYCVDNYPKVEGITTYLIGGNHDESFYKENGTDVCELFCAKREDFEYLGQYQADVTLGDVKFRLLHSDKAGAYAISYHSQKIAEQIASGNKPHIFINGHWHTSFMFWYRNMHIFSAGTFQGQTDFMMRKALNPAIGGWICSVRVGNEDPVVALEATWIPFYDRR